MLISRRGKTCVIEELFSVLNVRRVTHRHMMRVLLIVSALLAMKCCAAERSPLKYKAIQVLIRHGDRDGYAQFPEVPDDWHFIKSGDLTPKGCMKEYASGIVLRELMPDIARRNSTVLQSASAPSPLVADSLECFMNGINGPSEQIDRRDPPVFVAKSKGDDILLNFGRVSCPIRDQATQKDPSFLKLYDKYRSLIDTLNKGTGENLTEKDLMNIIKGRLEPIVVADEVGRRVPHWADETFLREAEKLADEEFAFVVNHTFQRALSAVFLRKLISDFKNAPNDSVSFFGYGSVHTTMGPLMKTFDLWTGLRPTYGEAVIFTLDINDEFEIFHLTEYLQVEPHIPPGCDEKRCTLEMFENAMKNYLKLDWESECNKSYSSQLSLTLNS